MKTVKAFDPNDMAGFEATEKVGLLATVNPEGLPHISLITTLQAKTPTQLAWGQFTEGLSKEHVKQNPRTGFLIMTLNRKMWRGKALYTHAVREGEDYVAFNEKPMFRYNSYFGINTVHYMDLLETTEKEPLPLGQIVPASLLTMAAKAGAKTSGTDRILNQWSQELFNKIDAVTFLSYVNGDGYPVIIPLLQCQAADSRRLAFSPLAYEKELAAIPSGDQVAIFALTFQMENILVRGVFQGFVRSRLVKLGLVDINWVYNSMPPKHGQIYPRQELEPVIDF